MVNLPQDDVKPNQNSKQLLTYEHSAKMNVCKLLWWLLLHVTQEFHFIKLICRNLYAFSHVKKAYTANQNGVQLFSHVANQR